MPLLVSVMLDVFAISLKCMLWICCVTYCVMYYNLLQMLDYNVPGGVAWECLLFVLN